MFGHFPSGRYKCLTFVANLFIILFITRVAASPNESDVLRRNSNTPCSIRLTRQSVLIQEDVISERPANKRRTRVKYNIFNGHECLPSDIVVEELQITARTNVQTRPMSCRDCPTANTNHTSTRIYSASLLPRRTICCYGESLVQENPQQIEVKHSEERSNNTPIFPKFASQKTNAFLDATTVKPRDNSIIFSTNDTYNPLLLTKKKSSSYKAMSNNDKSSPAKKREVKGSRPSSASSSIEEKLHSPVNQNGKFVVRACDKKSGKSMEIQKNRYKHKSQETSDKINVRYCGMRGKDRFPEGKVHRRRKRKHLFAFDEIRNMAIEIINRNESSENRGLSSGINKIEKNYKNSLFLFDGYKFVDIGNNKLCRPIPLAVSYDVKMELHRNKKANRKAHKPHLWNKRKTLNSNYDKKVLRLKKRATSIDVRGNGTNEDEQGKFVRIHDDFEESSIPSVAHNLIEKSDKGLPGIDGNLINNPKKTTNGSRETDQKEFINSPVDAIGKEKSSSKKERSKVSKSSAKQIRNATKGKTEIDKKFNHKFWNFSLPSMFTTYITYLSSFFGPSLRTNVGDDNRPTLPRDDLNKTNTSNTSPEELRKNVSAANVSLIIDENVILISTETSLRNSTEKDFGHSATSDPSNSAKRFFKNSSIFSRNFSDTLHASSTEVWDIVTEPLPILNTTKIFYSTLANNILLISQKNVYKTVDERNDSKTTSKTLTGPDNSTTVQPYRSNELQNNQEPRKHSNIHSLEELAKIKYGKSNVSISRKSMERLLSNGSDNNSINANDRNNEQVTRIGKDISAISNFRSDETAEQLSNGEQSIVEFIPRSINDRMKNSSWAMSPKADELFDKATLNFTIIDINCKPSNNNSADESPKIVDLTVKASTYPTLRRYSRNDTVVIIRPSKKIHHVRNSDEKISQTKSSLNDLRPSGAFKRRHGGSAIARGRNRIRIEGKHPVGVNLLLQNGKNSWQKNDASMTSNLTRPSFSTQPSSLYGASVSVESGMSAAVTFSRTSSDSWFSTVKPFFNSSTLPLASSSALLENHDSPNTPTLLRVSFDNHDSYIHSESSRTTSNANVAKTSVNLPDGVSNISDFTAMLTSEIARSTMPTDEDFFTDKNDSHGNPSEMEFSSSPVWSTAGIAGVP